MRELWFWCEGQEPKPFLAGMEGIQDYTAAGDGRAIFYLQKNNSGSTDLWIIDSQNEAPRRLETCSSPLCGDLEYRLASNTLAFSDFEIEPRLKLFDLERRQIEVYSFNATDLEFSPDGKHLAFFDRNKDKLVVLNILDGEYISVDSQEGLSGGWSSDSQQMLYGAMNFQGEIPGVNVFTLNIGDGQSESIGEWNASSIEYYQPRFFQSIDHFIAAVRDPSVGFNKQLWVINREGDLVDQITSDYTFDHSAFQLNSSQTKILFQRFSPVTPNSLPEVWVVDLESYEQMLVSKNATSPQWVSPN